MHTIRQDIVYALRTFRKRPAFTATAIFTLTLAIGVNSVVFTLLRGVVLSPLNYPQSARLVRLGGLGKAAGGRALNLSQLDFRDFKRASRGFERIGAFSAGIGAVTITGFGDAERVRSVVVSGGFFPALQSAPELGRLLQPDDDTRGLNVAVISHGLWQSHFGADPATIGHSVSIGRVSFTIVGILPAGFRFPQPELQGDPDLYAPIGPDSAAPPRSSRTLRAVGRLKPGIAVAQAQSELASIAAELERRYPSDNLHAGVVVQPLIDTIVGDTRPVLWLLLGATLSVLVIGCANLANLTLAKGLGRGKEIAIRAALGAGRPRLVRQLLTESLLLSLLGGVCALAAGGWLLQAAVALGRQALPRVNDIHPDSATLGFSLLLALAASLLFGAFPALRLSNTSLGHSLRQGGRSSSSGNSRPGAALVVAEVALCMNLVAAACLLVHSFWKLSHAEIGFRPGAILTAQVSLPANRYPQDKRVAFFDELYDRLQRLPGVQGVAAANILPLSGNHSCDAIRVDAHPVPAGQLPCAETRSVSAGYFRVMGIPLLRGRQFDARDDAGSPNVVLVNQAMAQWLWAAEDPVGQTITIASLGAAETPRQVIGIVGNAVHAAIGESPVPQYYIPQHQLPGYPAMSLIVRASSADGLTAGLRRELARMDQNVPLFNPRTLAELQDASVANPRFRTLLFAVFAIVALALAIGGVYGVLTCTVTQRMHELGLRLCLGARRRDIVALLLRQSMLPVGFGIALGSLGVAATQQWIAALLYGSSRLDPWTFALLAAGALSVSALAAIYGPIRRATACDPCSALREN